MNNNAKKWVEALRSGEYQQTTKNLHDKNGFCCLGVACDLYGKEKGIEWEAPKVQGDTGLQFIGSEAILPSLVKEWLGLRDNGSYYYTPGTKEENLGLASANDSGNTFLEIADIIESEPEGLFA